MTLSDLAARLRQLAGQLQADGRYDPARECIAHRGPSGVDHGGRYLAEAIYPLLLDARDRGAFSRPDLTDIRRRIDPTLNYPQGPAVLGVLDELAQRGFDCWGLDPKRGAIERLADAFAALADQRPAEHDSAEPADGYFSVAELAARFSVDPEPARKALDRWRKKHAGGDGYTENADRRPNEPQFLYSARAVEHVLSAVKRRATSRELRRTKTSGQRPAR